jgi:hypothetical protein
MEKKDLAKKAMNEASKQLPKFVFKARHVRWNWQSSPESTEDNQLVRYHFLIADDRFLEGKLDRIISNAQEKSIINYNFNEIRNMKGKFKSAGLNYLFKTYDSNCTPNFINFEGVSENIKKDKDLVERTGLKIEDYIERVYEKD